MAAQGLFLLCGCGPRAAGGGAHTEGHAQVGDDVVSTVDGVAITLSDVRRLVHISGLRPDAALERLQSEALLSGEARRRGYRTDEVVTRVGRQASVQALLAREVESVRATEAEIAAAFDKQHERFHTPERRASAHVLVSVAPGATAVQDALAKALAQQACGAFAENADVDAVLAEFRARQDSGLRVEAQRLPSVANDGSYVAPFLAALFSQPSLGAVPEPVRTQFGWHAIIVTAITPEKNLSLDDAREKLRAELTIVKQRAALAALLVQLETGTRVAHLGEAQRAMAALEL